ncbi:MAG: SusC/RagA family TonB-linked outer membrane protein [Bacteroidales bacterium]
MKITNFKILISFNQKIIVFIVQLFVVFSIQAQSFVISGAVTDKSGSPLVGVSIIVKDSKIGTVTDLKGNFKLTATTSNVVLKVSYIGFDSQEVKYKSGQQLVVKLEEDAVLLKETVVIGYGSQEKKTISSSVSTVNIDEIATLPTSTVSEALAGKMAGVLVESSANDPGAGAKITIRGNSSLRTGDANNALVVIDGIVGGDINSVNPNDIASMQVLKDAASSSIYGSRGSNGVIIITTKAPARNAKLKIDYNAYFGVSEAQNVLKAMDSQTFVNYINDGIKNKYNLTDMVNKTTYPTIESYFISLRSKYPGFFKHDGSGPAVWQYDNVNWKNLIYQTGFDHKHSITLSGTKNKIGYRASIAYTKQDGVIVNSGYDRINGNLQLTYNPIKPLTLRVSYYLTANSTRNKLTTAIRQSLQAFPMMNPRLPDGTWATPDTWQAEVFGLESTFMNDRYINPVRDLNLLSDISNTNDNRFALFAEWKLSKKLKLTSSVSYLFRNSVRNNEIQAGYGNPTTPYSLEETYSTGNQFLQENYLTYDFKNKNGKHNLNIVAGNTLQRNESSGYGIKDDVFTVGSKVQVINSLLSFYGRLNYHYDYRYMFTATARTDASSRFGVDNRWGFFPSASVAWSIADEPLFKDNVSKNAVSTLKIKASAGVTGNENIPVFNHLGIMTVTGYANGTDIKDAYISTSLSNNILSWETTVDYNIGFEAGFLKNRISFLIETYNKQTSGLLFNAPVPWIMGHSTSLQNIGSIENKGLEFSLTTRNIIYKNFSWTTNLNISANRNKVLKLANDGAPVFDDYTITQEGKPMGQFYVFKVNGIYQNASEISVIKPYVGAYVGNYIIEDTFGNDGVIDTRDRIGMGNPEPKFTYGILNTFTYRKFSLGIQLTGSYGNQVLNGRTKYEGPLNMDYVNQLAYTYFNSWSLDKPNARFAAPVIGIKDFRTTYFFSNQIEDGSFLRIQNVSLAYDMPTLVLKKLRLSKFQLMLTAQNLFTFTNYSGTDPQQSWGYMSNPLRRGVDSFDGYPLQRTYSIGLNINY